MKKPELIGAILLLSLSLTAFAQTPAMENTSVGAFRFQAETGLQIYQQTDTARPLPPKGLEELYRWMEMTTDIGDTHFLSMPNGRVLAMIRQTATGSAMTAQGLCELWPELAKELSRTAAYFYTDSACADVIQWKGHEWMNAHTYLVLDGNTMLSVALDGYANCENGIMNEIWIATPADQTYLYDKIASAELAADKATAESWLNNLRLGEENE